MIQNRLQTKVFRGIAAGLLLGLLACNQPSADPRELTAKLPDKHGNAFHQTSQGNFEAAVARLDQQIPNLAYNEVLSGMGRIVAMVGDGHTELWLPQSWWRQGGLTRRSAMWLKSIRRTGSNRIAPCVAGQREGGSFS